MEPTLSQEFTDRIQNIMTLLKNKADYWDVRFGKREGTVISYRSKVLEEISFPKVFGGSVRVLKKGGWGFVTFRDLGELKKAAQKAFKFARLVGKGRSFLAPIKTVQKIVLAKDNQKDFLKVKTEEKVRLLDFYRDLIWQSKTALAQSEIWYSDVLMNKLFVSSEGSVIEQEFPRLRCLVELVAKKNDVIQEYYENLSFKNFSDLKGKELKIKKAIEIVNQLLSAPVAEAGEYPVVMDGKLAGTFAHEAFGHLSEADTLEKDKQLRKIMKLGRHFGNRNITILDNPNQGSWGSYRYDDEGVRAKKAVILNKGVLVGLLNNRQTAASLKQKSNGHARAEGAQNKPLVRMGTIVIEPGNDNLEKMFSGIKRGYYCLSWLAGNTVSENFTFSPAYAYEIINGKLGRMVRDLKISGNIFDTLKLVEAVGSQSVEEPGTCIKFGQRVPAGTIAPSLRLEKILVMGVKK